MKLYSLSISLVIHRFMPGYQGSDVSRIEIKIVFFFICIIFSGIPELFLQVHSGIGLSFGSASLATGTQNRIAAWEKYDENNCRYSPIKLLGAFVIAFIFAEWVVYLYETINVLVSKEQPHQHSISIPSA